MAKDEAASELRVETEKTGPVVCTVSVEVPQARVRKAFDSTYKEIGRSARIKGFRPGKAPRSVLEKMYGSTVPDEVERTLVKETLEDALEMAEVQALSEPDVQADRPAADSPFTYSARVEVKPEIELPDLTGLPGKRPVVVVSDADVDQRLEMLQQQQAQWIEEDEGTAAAEGHTVTIDYVGKVDGVPFEGGTGSDMEVEIGSGRLIPGFEEGLTGAVSGEERSLDLKFPEDYGADSLSGKDAVFEVQVTAVKRKQMPELDDEFAKDLDEEIETLDDLRTKIRDEFKAARDRDAEQALKRSVVEALLERADFEVPPGVVDRQLQNQLQSMHRQYQHQVPEEILQQQLARMQEEGRPAAELRVKEAFLLEAVAKSKGFEVDPAEVTERMHEVAAAQGMPAESFMQIAEQQGMRQAIASELLDEKALDFLVSEATVEDVAEDEDETSAEA